MKIALLNEGDWGGNAYKLVALLTASLARSGADVSCHVRMRRSSAPHIQSLDFPTDLCSRFMRGTRRVRISCNDFRWKRHADAWERFDSGYTQYGTQVLPAVADAEVLNLHFVSQLIDVGAFLPVAARNHHIVWTIHDMNPFTGGCHFDCGCDRFVTGCGSCPQLASRSGHDLSARAWQRKKQAFLATDPQRLTLVAPSKWMAEQLGRSPLTRCFQIRTIPYGVDLEAFKPRGREQARDLLGLPQDKRIVLFVAQSTHNKRKGFSLLCEALALLSDMKDLCLVSVGVRLEEFTAPRPHYHLGYFDNDRLLSLAYSAADLFVVPSLQDNLPCTVLEALACGTPIVGFDVGGVPDMVRPGVTGQLAETGSVPAFAEAVRQILLDDDHRREISLSCRRTAEQEYSPERQSREYMKLFESLAGDR